MNKKLCLMFAGMFLFGAASAAHAQQSKHFKGDATKVSSNSTIEYKGKSISLPATGNDVFVGQDKKGHVVLEGRDTQGVKVDNKVISFYGPAVVSVNKRGQVDTLEGNAIVKNLTEDNSQLDKDEIPEFVKKAATKESYHDRQLLEKEALSPYAPR